MRYVFMRYPEGKFKAVTFSYDDGVRADIRFAGILDKYKMIHYNAQCNTMHPFIDASERGFMNLRNGKNESLIYLPFTLTDNEFRRIKRYITRVVNERYKKNEKERQEKECPH